MGGVWVVCMLALITELMTTLSHIQAYTFSSTSLLLFCLNKSKSVSFFSYSILVGQNQPYFWMAVGLLFPY